MGDQNASSSAALPDEFVLPSTPNTPSRRVVRRRSSMGTRVLARAEARAARMRLLGGGVLVVVLALGILFALPEADFDEVPSTWSKAHRYAKATVLDAAGSVAGALLKLLHGGVATSGRYTVRGLNGSAEVVRDARGITHVYADNMHDLGVAQGFAHAQDRMWQLEMNRLVATGRTASLFGEKTLKLDRLIANMGLRKSAQEELERIQAANDPNYAFAKAYAEGINAFLAEVAFGDGSQKLPVEFGLLHHVPQWWGVSDVFAYSRLLCATMSKGWDHEVVRQTLVNAVGAEKAASVSNLYREDAWPVELPENIERNGINGTPRFQHGGGGGSFWAWFFSWFGIDICAWFGVGCPAPGGVDSSSMWSWFSFGNGGSNSWIVDGRFTESGKPLLAGDPHLPLTLPGQWYVNYLHVKGRPVVAGTSLPGQPGLVCGTNGKVAWSITLGRVDTEDLFLETLSSDGRKYLFRGDWHDVEVREERIEVAGRAEPHIEQVHSTHHGPLVHSILPVFGEQPVALQTVAANANSPIWSIVHMLESTSVETFRESQAHVQAPTLNFVVGDVAGNIGLVMVGQIPVRAKGCGEWPSDGAAGEHEWTGMIPWDESPHAFNPKQGFLVSANNKVVPDSFKYCTGYSYANGHRAGRITTRLREYIDAGVKLNATHFHSIQMDTVSMLGEQLMTRVGKILENSTHPYVQQALRALGPHWNGSLDVDSASAVVYQVFKKKTFRMLLEPELGRDLMLTALGRNPTPVLRQSSEFWGFDAINLYEILSDADNLWVQEFGGCAHLPHDQRLLCVTEQGMLRAVEWIRAELGTDERAWRWGDLHPTYFRHALGRLPVLAQVFNRGPYQVGGDGDTVLMAGEMPHTAGYTVEGWSQSSRVIVDFANLNTSQHMAGPGQSGHLASPHYDDLLHAHLSGEMHPFYGASTPTRVHVLTLQPMVDANAESGSEGEGKEGMGKGKGVEGDKSEL